MLLKHKEQEEVMVGGQLLRGVGKRRVDFLNPGVTEENKMIAVSGS